MIEILQNILYNPEFILLASIFRPLPIFGSNSGKIKFADIISNVTLDEDNKGITISTFFNQAVDKKEIAFGTGATAGLTSSKYFKTVNFEDVGNFYNRSSFLIGVGQINPRNYFFNPNSLDPSSCSQNCNYGLYRHSIIINGCLNCIGYKGGAYNCFDTPETITDVSISGYKQIFTNYNAYVNPGKSNVLIDGKSSKVCGSVGSVILGQGNLVLGCYDSIINSYSLIQNLYNGCDSSGRNSIISSYIPIGGGRLAEYSSMISSRSSYLNGPSGTSLWKTVNSTIISSFQSLISAENSNSNCQTLVGWNTILSSKSSSICGSDSKFQYGDCYTRPSSCFSSIISGYQSKIKGSKQSVVIGGYFNQIYNSTTGGPTPYNKQLYSSAIIGGNSNKIDNGSTSTEIADTCRGLSTIISGCENCIILGCNSSGSVIISGACSCIGNSAQKGASGSSIISSYKSLAFCGDNSSIISSYKSNFVYPFASSSGSVILSSSCVNQYSPNTIDISVIGQIFDGKSCGYCGIRISTYKSYFGNTPSNPQTPLAYEPLLTNSIISSGYSGIKRFPAKDVLGVHYNGIIGSKLSKICGSNFSVILSACNSCLIVSTSSVISGGNNQILFSRYSSIISSKNSLIGTSSNSAIIGGCLNTILNSNSSVILGGCGLTLSSTNCTTLVQNFNFACAGIFESLNSSCCDVRVGTFSNCFYCTIKIRNGFVVN